MLLASCAALFAQSAGAADLPAKAPILKAAPYAAWNWTGVYVGGYAGVGVSRSRGRDPDGLPPGDVENTGYGFTGGGVLGYNHQLNWGILGQRLVVGVEGDIGSFDTGHQARDWNDAPIYNSKTSWLATARARAGLTDGPTFNYVTAGFAAAHVKDSVRNASVAAGEISSSGTETGYVFGSGVETMLGGGWSAKTESLYINLSSGDTLQIPGSATLGLQQDRREYFTQRFGLNYQFGAGKNGPLKQTNWNGLYVGGAFGGAVGSVRGKEGNDISTALPNSELGNNGSGFTAGGQIGYNWMIMPKVVVGLEGDVSYFGIDHMSNNYFNVVSNNPGVNIAALTVDTSWIATARGRVAYNTGPALLYATGGGAWVNVKDTFIGSAGAAVSSSKTLSGWTVGGGIETVLWGNWSTKTEYLYVDAGKGDLLTSGGFSIQPDHVFHLFRSGITYRFNGNPLASKF
jgi:outer membrane immunogenic protein